MVKPDYNKLIDELELAIDRDQLYIVRDLLKEADEGIKSSIISTYFEKHAEKLDAIRAEIKKTEELLDTLDSEENWTKCAEKKGSVVYFQKQEGNPCIFTKLESLFPSDPENVISLFTKLMSFFYETELMPHMYPKGMMRKAEQTGRLSKFSKSLVTQVGMPRPLNMLIGPREAHLLGKGYDLSEQSKLAITVTTLEKDDEVGDFVVPGLSKGYSKLLLDAAYYFELTEKGIIFKMIQCLDLCSNMIPQPVLNYVSKGVLPFQTLANMKKLVKEYEGSPWDLRVKANVEVYGEVEKRLAVFLLKTYGLVHKPLSDNQSKYKDEISTKMSVVSGSGRRRRKGVLSRISRGVKSSGRSRSRSNTGKKLSRKAKRSYNNLDKVELYDFELTNSLIKEVKVDEEEVEVEQPKKPEGFLQFIVYYFVLILVKLFALAGKKQKLAEINPNFERRFPRLFNE